MELTGRNDEVTTLKNALVSRYSELIVVYGRRRIGKTFLIRNVYRKSIVFEFSGIHNEPFKKQLLNFDLALSEKAGHTVHSSGWITAFNNLGKYIDTLRSKKKKVIFIDEFPWLDTRRSGFLAAFDNFWNNYATKRNDLVVVICGSAASYMIQNIIKSKGGLHNRITIRMQLLPFSLRETEILLKRNNVKLTRYDIATLYMTMGGIPFYLQKVQPGESAVQAVDRLCFRKDGFLRDEFDNVFSSLFDKHENHENIIRILAGVRHGLKRNDIMKKSRIKSGGTLSKTLDELEESGFIEKYLPYKGIKDSIYRLSDEYSLFYLKFIEKNRQHGKDIWLKMQGQPSWKIWAGFSFEALCLKHIAQIKEGLKISGILSESGSWYQKNTEKGAQIDLVIDRSDNVINLCEIKFNNKEFEIDSRYARELLHKADTFVKETKTNKAIFTTFITSNGVKSNVYYKQLVQNEVTLNHLYE